MKKIKEVKKQNKYKLTKKELEEFKKLPNEEKKRLTRRLHYKKRLDVFEKPCLILEYCPYGGLVEYMAFLGNELDLPELSCPIFGHDCPVYTSAEYLDGEKFKQCKK